jgi:hypothetical protein
VIDVLVRGGKTSLENFPPLALPLFKNFI